MEETKTEGITYIAKPDAPMGYKHLELCMDIYRFTENYKSLYRDNIFFLINSKYRSIKRQRFT